MRADGLAIPGPTSRAGYVDLAAQAARRACCAYVFSPPLSGGQMVGQRGA